MMWYWSSGVHWWGWVLGLIGMVAFWGLIIWALWYFVAGMTRRSGETRGYREQPGDAKRILDERLARGEIDADEYRRLLDVIRGGQTPSYPGRV